MRTPGTALTAPVMREIFARSLPSEKFGTASKSGAGTAALAGPEGAVEVDGGAYEGEMGEGLGEVA